MKAKFAFLLLSVALVAAACNNNNTKNTTTPPPPPPPGAATPPPPPQNVISGETTVTIGTDGKFSPAQITVKKGTKVSFVNNASNPRWPASAPHPTHTDYPEFDPKKAVAAGGTWSFTFDKTGTWAYHDHLFPSNFGRVTVVE